jgi:MFS transporter, CP family, cyanate transporter
VLDKPTARGAVRAPPAATTSRAATAALNRLGPEPPLGYRWTMLGLNSLLYLSFGLASSSMAALAVAIAADMHLTSAQLGAILGSWQLAYVGCALAAGLALDRFGVRRTMSAGAVIVGLSALARAFAVDFPSLLLAVALFGVGGPMISVGSNKVVSEWFQGAQRGPAIGIASSAPTVGSVAILALGNSVLAPLFGGWRGAFLACGSVSIVAALAWIVLAREAPRHRAARQQRAERPSIRRSVVQLLRLPNVRLILVSSVGLFMLSHGIANWLPTLLVSRGMTPAESGFWVAVSTAIGLPTGLLLPRYAPLGRRRYVIFALGLASAAAVSGLALLSGLPLLAGLVVFGITRAGTTPLMLLVLMDMREIGAARTGAAAGLYFTFGEMGGFGGPFLIGVLSGAGSSFALPLVLLALLQGLIALTALRLREAT